MKQEFIICIIIFVLVLVALIYWIFVFLPKLRKQYEINHPIVKTKKGKELMMMSSLIAQTQNGSINIFCVFDIKAGVKMFIEQEELLSKLVDEDSEKILERLKVEN